MVCFVQCRTLSSAKIEQGRGLGGPTQVYGKWLINLPTDGSMSACHFNIFPQGGEASLAALTSKLICSTLDLKRGP